MHPEDYDRLKVIKYIESCYTIDQIDTAEEWVSRLFKIGKFQTKATEVILSDVIARKRDDILKGRALREHRLPHLIKRAGELAKEEESRSHLKLVKVAAE